MDLTLPWQKWVLGPPPSGKDNWKRWYRHFSSVTVAGGLSSSRMWELCTWCLPARGKPRLLFPARGQRAGTLSMALPNALPRVWERAGRKISCAGRTSNNWGYVLQLNVWGAQLGGTRYWFQLFFYFSKRWKGIERGEGKVL